MQLKILGIEGAKSIDLVRSATAKMSAQDIVAVLAKTKLNNEEKRQILQEHGLSGAELQAAMATATHTTSTRAASAATTGLIAKTYSLEAALHGLKAAFMSNPLTAILTILLTLISVITSVVDKITNGAEEAKQKAKETAQAIKDSYSEAITNIESNLKKLGDLKEDFDKLSKGVDDYGNNISLTTSEYERYKEIVETIIGISPSLISGYDSEGKAIANKNGLLEKSIKLMEEEQRLEKEKITTDSNLEKLLGGTRENIKEIEENAKSRTKREINLDSAMKHYLVETDSNGNRTINRHDYDSLDNEIIAQVLGIDYNAADEAWRSGKDSFLYRNIDEIYTHLDEIIIEVQKDHEKNGKTWAGYDEAIAEHFKQNILKIKQGIDDVKAESDTFNEYLQLVPQSLTQYSNLNDSSKNFISDWIRQNFSIDENTTDSDISKFTNQIKTFTKKIANDANLSEIITEAYSFKNTSESTLQLTANEYKNQAKKIIDKINEIEDEDTKNVILSILGLDEDENALTKDIDTMVSRVKNIVKPQYKNLVDTMSIADLKIAYEISASEDSLTFDELKEKINDVAPKVNAFEELMSQTGTAKDPSFVEKTEKTIEKLQKLQDALSKVESGTLKDSERMSLFKTFPQLTAYADNLAEGIKHVTDSMRSDIVSSFNEQIAKFNEQGASEEEIAQLNAYKDTVLGIADAVATTQNALSSMQTVFQDLDKIVKDYNENQYFSLESLEKLSTSSGQKYLQYLTYENGQLKVNEEAYKKLVLAQIDEIETKATLQATTDLQSLSDETTAKEYLAKVNIELADSQLTAAQAAFQYALALKLAEGGNVAKAAQKVADNLNTLRNIFASAREQAKSYSGAMLGAATATDKKAKASEKAKDALEKEKTALEHSKEALEQEKKALEKNKSEYEKAKNAIQSLIEWTQKYIKQIKENEIKALEEQKKKFDEVIEKRKEQLQAEKDLHEYEKSLSEKQNTLASNTLKAAIASLDDSAAGKKTYKKAQEEYKTSQTDLQDFLYEHEIEVREQALDKLKEDTDKSYQDQIDKIQEFLNDEVKMYREACSMIDNDNGTLYGKLLEYCLNYTTTGRAEFDYMWTEAKSAMDKYNTANLSTIDLINDLQGRIYDVDSAIDTLTTNIETYENRISNLKNQIDDLKDAAIEAKNAIDVANSTPLNPDPPNGKTSFWVNYNGKKYETGYNYNGDTKGNRLLAASELTKLIAKDVSGFENYGLSQVQALLGVGGNETGHKWTYKFDGKTYESRAATKTLAVADIRSQLAKKYGNSSFVLDQVYGKITGYAEGTKSATGGLHIVDEEGLFSEFIPYQIGKGRYSFLPEGNPVFSKAMTDTMFDFASNPTSYVNKIVNSSNRQSGDINIDSPIYIQGDATQSTVRAIKKEKEEITDNILKKVLHYGLMNKKPLW